MSDIAQSMQDRIAVQERRLVGLEPGSAEHRIATQVLLLMRDSLYLQQQIDELIAEMREREA